MSLELAEHPARDRPRERLWAIGPAALTGQELLAVLLGTGCVGRDALAVAGELLARVDGSLRRLAARPPADLARVAGVGRGKAARVVAALELGRRLAAEAAAGIIVVHNHPSGDPTPSADDRAVTRQLVEAGRLLDLPVYDHVIVAGDGYLSFAEAGLL